ncbi:MAG TPA: YiiX/YebB-like N1pC/P60 family cysteine hydrolase [Stenomitos sp.]
MISNAVANSLRPTLRRQAQAVAAKAAPQAATQAAKEVAAHAVVADSTWYTLKKKFIGLISNFNYNKAEVHAVTAEMADRVQPRLKAGDILLRRTEGTSGNWFIPSWWKHAGVYVGDGQVVDATFHGIGKRSFKSFMTEGDHVMIVRAKNLTADQRKSIANYAEHQVGKPYDFDFDFVDEARQSCTELANHAVRTGAGKELVQKNWIGSVTGDAFKNENFKLIWSSDPAQSKWLHNR